MYCHDVRHTGRSPYSTDNTDGVEKWNLELWGFLWGSPIIDDEGVIYVGAWDFYAIYPDGRLKWNAEGLGTFSSSGAIDENGILYVGTIWNHPNYFYAIDTSNGDLKWRKQISNHIFSSPAIGDDGTIYFGSENENIYAYYQNGTLRWSYKTGHAVLSSPAIGEDGTVYCGSHDTNLYAFHPNNGTVKWTYKTGHWIRTAPCIADDGTIYVVSLDDHLHAVNPDGTMKWKTDMGEGGTSPTIGQDGTIYCGYNQLHAINPSDGSIKWKLPVSGKIRGGTPCNSIDGTIYLGTDSGWIYAVNPDGTEKWRKSIGGDVESAPAIGEDGTVFIGDGRDDGSLHAFGPLDDNAPTAPAIKGSRICLPGIPYEYEFTSTSPLGNKLYYLIEWGDGEVTGWSGTYESGETRTFYHTWEQSGEFTIKARAKDTDNLWGLWSKYNVNRPRYRTVSYLVFLENFPMLERLLFFF
jgi:outer membrane protein assembly factor BamB